MIRFTKEEEKDNKLPVLDLELNINRKTKKIEFNIHYKKTNTFITIKKKSNHRESTKYGIIKGYSDRAKALCDTRYLQNELDNIEEMFVSNGYNLKEIKEAMQKNTKQKTEITEEKEREVRGTVSLPNVPMVTKRFSEIARQHNFRTTTKANNKIKDISIKAKTPLAVFTSGSVFL